jgi:hypothetical protein
MNDIYQSALQKSQVPINDIYQSALQKSQVPCLLPSFGLDI